MTHDAPAAPRDAAGAAEKPARFVAVGAGRMGRGIAVAFAYAGYRIALVDLRERTDADWRRLCAEVRAEIEGALQGLVAQGVMQQAQVAPVAARVALVRTDAAPWALAAAELVLEAVPETLQAKQEAFDRINAHVGDEAVLTSTTSSILVTQLAALVRKPARFLNMHWLNPAYVIPVVELSTHPGTDPAVLARTRAMLQAIGKLPVVCGATPGYIVPRLQALVMNEAARMIEEGAATAEEIDKATRYGLGLRFAALGVVEFIDFGGADILHHASREMAQSVDASRYAAPRILGDMVARNALGLKTGSGFYDYSGLDPQSVRHDVLARTLGMLRHVQMLVPPADRTRD